MSAIPPQAFVLIVRTLTENAPTRLVARFLSQRYPWLGRVPPHARGDELVRFVRARLQNYGDIPSSALAPFAWVHALAQMDGAHALRDAARSARVSLPSMSPVEMALFAIVEAPHVSEPLSKQIPKVEREELDYMAVVHKPIEVRTGVDVIPKLVDELKTALSTPVGVHVFESEHETLLWVAEDDLGTLSPDMLSIDRRTGRLSVDARAHRGSAYCRALGRALFGNGAHFGPFPTIRVSQVLVDPKGKLDVWDVPGLQSIEAMRACVANDGAPYAHREIRAPRVLLRAKRARASGENLIKVVFEARMDNGPKTLVSVGDNVLTYDRLNFEHVIRRWLESRGIVDFGSREAA